MRVQKETLLRSLIVAGAVTGGVAGAWRWYERHKRLQEQEKTGNGERLSITGDPATDSVLEKLPDPKRSIGSPSTVESLVRQLLAEPDPSKDFSHHVQVADFLALQAAKRDGFLQDEIAKVVEPTGRKVTVHNEARLISQLAYEIKEFPQVFEKEYRELLLKRGYHVEQLEQNSPRSLWQGVDRVLSEQWKFPKFKILRHALDPERYIKEGLKPSSLLSFEDGEAKSKWFVVKNKKEQIAGTSTVLLVDKAKLDRVDLETVTQSELLAMAVHAPKNEVEAENVTMIFLGATTAKGEDAAFVVPAIMYGAKDYARKLGIKDIRMPAASPFVKSEQKKAGGTYRHWMTLRDSAGKLTDLWRRRLEMVARPILRTDGKETINEKFMSVPVKREDLLVVLDREHHRSGQMSEWDLTKGGTDLTSLRNAETGLYFLRNSSFPLRQISENEFVLEVSAFWMEMMENYEPSFLIGGMSPILK